MLDCSAFVEDSAASVFEFCDERSRVGTCCFNDADVRGDYRIGVCTRKDKFVSMRFVFGFRVW